MQTAPTFPSWRQHMVGPAESDSRPPWPQVHTAAGLLYCGVLLGLRLRCRHILAALRTRAHRLLAVASGGCLAVKEGQCGRGAQAAQLSALYKLLLPMKARGKARVGPGLSHAWICLKTSGLSLPFRASHGAQRSSAGAFRTEIHNLRKHAGPTALPAQGGTVCIVRHPHLVQRPRPCTVPTMQPEASYAHRSRRRIPEQ